MKTSTRTASRYGPTSMTRRSASTSRSPSSGWYAFYQERFYQTIDKFNVFSTTFAEFMHVLMLPMEKSFMVLHDKIEEQIREGKTPEDPHEHYRLWVKILEGHYMTLFKTSEYTKTLNNTMSSYEDYLSARNQIVTRCPAVTAHTHEQGSRRTVR